jgi:hypothetical protein
MTFNWPDIPFSGTEVDAFVVEYKALAQAIIDDYDDRRVGISSVKLPFQRREDVKIFLEYGLTYAAFIVKQRAGNSGPGGDFQLGNSPISLILPPLMQRRLLEDSGPSSNDSARKKCFENNQNGKNPDGSTRDPDNGGNDDPLDWYMGEVKKGIADSTSIDCEPFIQTLNENEDEAQSREGRCMGRLLATYLAGPLAQALKFSRLTYLQAFTYSLVERYIFAVGGVYTLSNLASEINGNAPTWLREDIAAAINADIRRNNGKIFTIELTTQEKAAYGASESDEAVTVDGEYNFGLKNSLGDFTAIISDTATYDGPRVEFPANSGTFIRGLTAVQPSDIKIAFDDYDFNDYGYALNRTYADGDLPGTEFDDSQVKSGTEWNDDTTTPCAAAGYNSQRGSGNNPRFNYLSLPAWIRYVIADNHGKGKVDPGEYVGGDCTGKPFAIRFTWG